MRESTYRDGKQHGKSVMYHRQGGQPELEENFVNGRREGISITYSPRGNVITKIEYENGRKVRTVEDNRMNR
jgi:antitoxin component YwqK of YwqJK toxin-antitoxin module